MFHYFGSVVFPKTKGKMQRQKLIGATRYFRELTRQQSG